MPELTEQDFAFSATHLPVAIDYPAALALTRSDYLLTPPYPFVQLATLK